MKVIGLTGGIGSGKTFCARVFEFLGVPVYYADAEAKNLMQMDSLIRQGLVELFGKRSFRKNGQLNRSHLSKIIFKDPELLRQMNKLVHPAVRQHFMEWAARQDAAYIMQESAILFETGSYRFFDKIVLIDAPESLRIQRTIKRDGITDSEVRGRMANQWPSSKTRPLADFIIDNDDQSPVLSQIYAVHEQILGRASNSRV